MTPAHYCEACAQKSGSSFLSSFRFLSPDRRLAMTALYAFCREVDDVVDEMTDASAAALELDCWRQRIDRLFAGDPDHPVTQALLPAIKVFDLPRELFQEIIDGMAMDLGEVRYPDFKTLQLYCYRVASVVGLLSARIFGFTDRQTLRYAHDLGIAFQLTNIVRDVGEDADRGRIYLPQDELARYHVTEAQILAHQTSPGFNELMLFQIKRAESYYLRALSELPKADRRAQRPGLVMAAVYRAILRRILRDGCDVPLTRRVTLGKFRKLWLAWSTWVFAYRSMA